MAAVRRKFQTKPVPHELAAARCSLRIAAVGLRAGLVPTMEPAARGRSPADVSLEGPDGELRVEAKTLLRAELTRDVDAWLDVLTTPLMESVRIHRVRINGEANEPLDEASTVTLIADLTAACGAVAAGVSVPAVRAGRNRFEVVPAGSDQPATNIAMPAVNLWRRTAARITEAVGQTRRSGATWLLVESLDNLWQLTPWSTQTLASRAIALREEALRLVEDVQHLHGVVFTDGAALIDLHSPDERTNPVAGVFGIRQRIDRPRTRETIVIALRDDTAVADLREWQRVLEAEAGWAQWALDRVGLPSPPELRPLH
jgi:hypothetical protein